VQIRINPFANYLQIKSKFPRILLTIHANLRISIFMRIKLAPDYGRISLTSVRLTNG